jgi:hypothetical protein
MPRKVTAYACKYKCRRKVTTHRQDMKDHEERCKLNPARRTCATCKFEEPEEDGGGRGWYCTEEHLPEDTQMVYDCPYHVLRQE